MRLLPLLVTLLPAGAMAARSMGNLGTKTVKVKVVPGKTVVAKFPPYRPEHYRAP
jgi:hypothetical protein